MYYAGDLVDVDAALRRLREDTIETINAEDSARAEDPEVPEAPARKKIDDDIEAIYNNTASASAVHLPYKLVLRDYQEPLWDYMMQEKRGLRALTVWPRRNGKDLIALNILVAKAMQRVGLYLYIGPLHTQTRQIVWMGSDDEGRRFLDYIPPELIKGKRNSQMEIDLINGSMIKVVGSDQYDSLMGLNCMGAVFTEYSLQRPEAWDYIRPMMANNGGWALFNGTPRGLNHMHAMAQMAQKNPKWFYQYLTRDDTGFPTNEAIQEDRDAGMKESLIEQEYYVSWTSSGEDVFIPLDIVDPTVQDGTNVDPATQRLKPSAILHAKDYGFEPRILGCDVAYAAKGDKAVITYRQGRKVHFCRWYQGMDNMAFADEIARFIRIVRPHVVCIDAGRGEGVISRLEQLEYGNLVRGVHFGGKVYEEGIFNMKALMWTRMLAWFMSENRPDMTGLDECEHFNEPVEEQLVKELTTPFMLLDEKNQIRVEPKASLKQRGQSSPDLAEALGLTFAEEVFADELPDPRLEELGVTTDMIDAIQAQKEMEAYDPLSYMDNLMNGGSADAHY